MKPVITENRPVLENIWILSVSIINETNWIDCRWASFTYTHTYTLVFFPPRNSRLITVFYFIYFKHFSLFFTVAPNLRKRFRQLSRLFQSHEEMHDYFNWKLVNRCFWASKNIIQRNTNILLVCKAVFLTWFAYVICLSQIF